MQTNNKNVLITGSSDGIGLDIARTLYKEGFNIYLTGRSLSKLEKISKELNIPNNFFAINLLEGGACAKLVEKFPKVDVLINNAGEYVYSSIEKTKEGDISRLVRLNCEIPFILSGLYMEKMKQKGWGRIINIGSISAVVGEANASLYSASKSFLSGLTKSLALEVAQNNITVNMINPGFVATDLGTASIEQSEFSQAEYLDIIPQKRFVEKNEISYLCNYLISDNARGVTGQIINICAGLSLG